MTSHRISDLLIAWYEDNSRALPWRETRDPYRIWISEIILQQTRVQQGMDYYYRFVDHYPAVADLARAPLEEVLKLWQGLGYYSRARNLHAAANQVMSEFGGVFPKTYQDILMLKGVGPYTAAAIASFAYQEQCAVVDGNVYRVLSRLYDEPLPIDSGPGKRLFQALADELLSPDRPDLHNQGMMELGALVCTPTQPSCGECPLQEACMSFANGTVLQRPQKQGKTKVRDRYFQYFIFSYEGKLYLRQRKVKDIWSHLFEFFMIETEKPVTLETLVEHEDLKRICFDPSSSTWRVLAQDVKHLLSHQRIHASFYEVTLQDPLHDTDDLFCIDRADLHQYAIPQLLVKVLQKDGFIV